MIAIVLIALAAGCASALMFASTMSGVPVSLLLSLWHRCRSWWRRSDGDRGRNDRRHRCGRFGVRHLFRSALSAIAFAIAVALPAWWLGHLALLGRPVTNTAPGNGSAAGCTSTRMVSAWPYPALDRRLRHLLPACRSCSARAPMPPPKRCEARCCRPFLRSEGRPTGEIEQLGRRRDDDDLARPVGDVRRRRRLRSTSGSPQRSPQYRACCTVPGRCDAPRNSLADDTGRAVRRLGILFPWRNFRKSGADRGRGAHDGLRPAGPCRPSYGDAGVRRAGRSG